MTVATYEEMRNYYTGDGVQEEWPITFPFLLPEDIRAVLTDAHGIEHTLTLDADYTVSASADRQGGTLRTHVPAGTEIVIFLDQRISQGLDLRNNGLLDAESLEYSLDKITLFLAQLQDRMRNCLQLGMADKRLPDIMWKTFEQGVEHTLRLAEQVTEDRKVVEECLGLVDKAIYRFVNSEEIGTSMLQALNGSYAAYNKDVGILVEGYIERLRLEYAALSPLGKAGAFADEVRIEANSQISRLETTGQQYVEMVRLEGESAVLAKQEACRWADMTLESLETAKTMVAELPEKTAAHVQELQEESQRLQDEILASVLAGGQSIFPSGLICMWSGAVPAIPTGWALCNGENGTPDLRDKFVLGAGGEHGVGTSGGGEPFEHTHDVQVAPHTLTTAQMPKHTHTEGIGAYNSGGGVSDYQATRVNGTVRFTTSATGSSQAHSHTGTALASSSSLPLPPYYALAYIMKL